MAMVKQRVKLKFAKKESMRFISHLDLMRLFQRAARRAEIAVSLTEGFNPHLRISIQPALKLGAESETLEAVFKLETWIDPRELAERLQEQLPEGVKILEASSL